MINDFIKNPSKKTIVIVFFCILINFFGKWIAAKLQLPLWLDAFGTVFAAYVLGPFCGAVVGVSGNITYAIINSTSLIYSLTSLFIGISVGFLARKKYFDTFFHAMSVAGMVTAISVCISTTINLFCYKGSTGNVWGDGVKDFLIEKKIPSFFGSVIGEFYLDFLDKVVMVLALFLLIRVIRTFREKKVQKAGRQGLAALLLFSLFSGTGFFLMSGETGEAKERGLDASYIQTIYGRDNGLPCGHANDLAQTNDGILWVGTYAGLYRYNGAEFRLMDGYDAVKNVNCLYVDEEGRLWIGTNDNGVVIAINEKIANVMDSKTGLPSDSIRCITQSADGSYYIGTSDSMAVMTLKTGISVLKVIPEIAYAVDSTADKNGYIAAVTSEGTLFLVKEGKVINSLVLTEEEGGFSSCRFHGDGRLYAGTSEGKVHIYSIKGDHLEKDSVITCTGLSKINQIAMGADGMIGICADNGTGFLSADHVFTKFETGSFNTSIETMEMDYQGNLWLASSRLGLLRLSVSSFTDIYSELGVEKSVVNTTAVWNDLLYVGTDDGLDILDLIHRKSRKDELTNLLNGLRIRCLQTDSKGDLWICTYGKGLLKVDRQGKIRRYDSPEDGIGNRVRICLEQADQTMAVGGDNGISFIKDKKVLHTIPYGDELGSAHILCFSEMTDGRLLAGTDGNGIAVIRDGRVEKILTQKDGLSSGVVLRLVPDVEEDHFFIVTSNGLCYWKEDTIRPVTNFPYSNNYDISIDEDGEMFVLGSAGIYELKREDLFTKDEFDYRILNTRMGLSGTLTANSWNGEDSEKNLYLSTDQGVYIMNKDHYLLDRGSYRIMVSAIRLDEEVYPIDRSTELMVARSVGKIELVPEIVNYTLEDPTVSYYLEGLETKWKKIPQSALSSVTYTNLPSGKYVFHLAILDDDTGDILEESTYAFEKERTIYDNWWFMVYMILVGGIFVGWLSWFITRTQIQRTFALQQSRLQLALQQVQMGNETILAIAKTVDAKDELTSKHSQRVSEYSVLIAKEIGFSESEQENLKKAALLHDIGKIGIPDSILNKPARLTDEEYEVMKSHVTRGAEILKDFTLIDHVVDGARYHHERYDGRGYPDGLQGEEIPLYGRIIAVADAFDAMTANRVYRKKLDFDFVLGELKRGRGTQFDPKLLDVFLKMIDEGKIDVESLYAKIQGQGDGEDGK